MRELVHLVRIEINEDLSNVRLEVYFYSTSRLRLSYASTFSNKDVKENMRERTA